MNERTPRTAHVWRLIACASCAFGATAVAAPVHLTEAWLTVESPAVLQAVDSRYEVIVDHGHRTAPDGSTAHRIAATSETLRALERDGYTLVITPSPRIEDDGNYSSPAEGHARLSALVDGAPRAGLVQMGTSHEGRPILAAWFGQEPRSGAPDVRVLGAHHGDEWSSFEVALATAELLATEDGLRTDVTHLLDKRTVWVAPYINPDGVTYRSRQNANNVDLNRNYDFHWSQSAFLAGDAPFSEPETRAVRAHALTTAPPVSLSLHSGATNVGYVWNYSLSVIPERPIVEALAQTYAGSCTTPNFWVTNGAEWYRTWGDTNDWSYGRYGGMDFTIEVTLEKRPDSEQIPTYTADHTEAVLAFLGADLPLSGQVRDAATGNPIPAELSLERSGTPISVPFSTDLDGRFARHTDLDGAELVVRSPGYLEVRTPPGSALEIELPAASLASWLTSPGRLPASTTRVEALGSVDGLAVLSQPGHPDHGVTITNGQFWAPALAGGAWTLQDADGTVFPRVLLVEDVGPALRSTSAVANGELQITGFDFAIGTRAWALLGTERALVERDVLSELPDQITIDATGLTGDVEFLTLTNGTWLAHSRRTESPEPIDTGTPGDSGDSGTSGDSGITSDSAATDDETVRPACGCASSPAPRSFLGFLAFIAIRRRRP